MQNADMKMVVQSLLVLMDETYVGPVDPRGTWIISNEPDSGLLKTLEKVTASDASKSFGFPGASTIAAHTNHLRFTLELANRAYRGENPYADANWSNSWSVQTVEESEWLEMVAELRRQYQLFRKSVEEGIPWHDADTRTGTMGQVAHGAYHLGAIRKIIQMIRNQPEG